MWRQIKCAFIHKNDFSLFKNRCFSQTWPSMGDPLEDGRFVSFKDIFLSFLKRKVQFVEYLGDVVGMVPDSKLLLNYRGNPTCRPYRSSEPEIIRSNLEEIDQELEFLRGNSSSLIFSRLGVQPTPPMLSCRSQPAGNCTGRNPENLSNASARPAFSVKKKSPFSSNFSENGCSK